MIPITMVFDNKGLITINMYTVENLNVRLSKMTNAIVGAIGATKEKVVIMTQRQCFGCPKYCIILVAKMEQTQTLLESA